MGAVYLATEAALEREVAIKVLPPDRGVSRESRDRFRREARTAAKLSHPHIVPLHTFGDVEGTLYFVMGYVRGESLATRIRREGKLAVEEVRRILGEIAGALDYAHGLGIVHRDIKPDNVLLEEGSGRAMLTDFGVAKALGAGQTVTAEGSILGTPLYMSPEQAQGRSDIDGRSDLYSLGVMGYAMLAGRLPFDGATPADILVQHITKEAPPLGAVAPDAPPELAAAITRCLAKDPAARFDGAQAFQKAIASNDDGRLPEAFAGFRQATQIVAVAGILTFLALVNSVTAAPATDPLDNRFVEEGLPRLLAGITAFAVVASLAGAYELTKKGHSMAAVVRAALLKPSWWFGPYPWRRRARGDVWPRLPSDVRKVRTLLALLAAWWLLLLLPFMIVTLNSADSYRRTGQRQNYLRVSRAAEQGFVLTIGLAPLALGGTALLYFLRWRRTLAGRPFIEKSQLVDRFVLGDTGRRSNWTPPEIAPLLLAAPIGVRSAAPPATPGEMVHGIERAWSSARAAGRAPDANVVEAARALATSIQALDSDIGALSKTFDQDEVVRLEAKLSALAGGPSAPGEERHRLREMFQTQLDFMRGLENRLQQVQARRARRGELLSRLWRMSLELDSRVVAEAAGDQLRGLLKEIETDQALSDAATLAAPGSVAISDLPTLES
jgi:hypothetical protein